MENITFTTEQDDIQIWIDCLDDDYDKKNDGVLAINY